MENKIRETNYTRTIKTIIQTNHNYINVRTGNVLNNPGNTLSKKGEKSNPWFACTKMISLREAKSKYWCLFVPIDSRTTGKNIPILPRNKKNR